MSANQQRTGEVHGELAAEVRAVIRDFPDFPRPGILFRDIAPLLCQPKLLAQVVDTFSHEAERLGAEVIAGIESRGFIFGTPVALNLGRPFVLVRKQGKLPGETVAAKYDLEYGSAHLEIQKDKIQAGQQVLVVDDLLATGGTALATAGLIERLGGIVAGIAFLIELGSLNGRAMLTDYNIFSLLDL